MITLLRGHLKRRALRSRISRAIDSRVGFYKATFPFDRSPERLIAWCRDSISKTGRPYGVDFITLGIALETVDGSRLQDAVFRVLRPGDFYSQHGVAREIDSILSSWIDLLAEHESSDLNLQAILFSWGDLTSDLLKAS